MQSVCYCIRKSLGGDENLVMFSYFLMSMLFSRCTYEGKKSVLIFAFIFCPYGETILFILKVPAMSIKLASSGFPLKSLLPSVIVA